LRESGDRDPHHLAVNLGYGSTYRIMKDGSVTLGWFIRNQYYPRRDWSLETGNLKIHIERHLLDI
jgi:hypothetical protein